MNLLVRGMGRAVADWMAEVVVFLNGAPVMVGIRGKPVPVPRRARMFMGRRRRARTERMKCCIFLVLVLVSFWCGRLEKRGMGGAKWLEGGIGLIFFALRGLRGKECIFYI